MTQQEFDATIARIMSKSWTATTLAEVFRPLSKADRNTIVGALMDKGFNADILYAALGKAGPAPDAQLPGTGTGSGSTGSGSNRRWLWVGLGVAVFLFGWAWNRRRS